MYIVDTKMVIRNRRRKRRTGATMAEINMTKGQTMIDNAMTKGTDNDPQNTTPKNFIVV